MIIRITESIGWDTEDLANEGARAWIAENVMSQSPEKDRYGRPCKWFMETETAVVTVVREYISPGKWAKKRDVLTVTGKEASDETL